MNVWIQVIAGTLLLVLGSRALWFFLGIVAFVAGRALCTAYLPELPETQALAISAVAAGLAVGLMVLARHVAVLVGGFLGGGYVGWVLWGMAGGGMEGVPWIAIVVGGVLGILVARLLVKLALAILSVAVGAGLIAMTLPPGTAQIALFALLVLVGFGIHAGLFRRKKEDHGSDAA